MSDLAVQPFAGTFRAQADPSTFSFAIRHSGVFWFRGSMSEVTATLRGDDDGLVLEGSARVESISVVQPAALRAHLFAPDFFNTEQHPDVTFRSTAIRLADDGGADVDGELTMRGVTRPVTATGRYAPPRVVEYGEVGGMQLQTTIDRREWGFDWQAQLPGGGEAIGWDVQLEIDLLLMRADAEPAA